MCSLSSFSRKIFCSSGWCFHCINFANRKQKSEAKILKSKDLCSKNLRKSTCQFTAYFSQSERKIGKKRIHKIFAKYDKKQDYGPFFSFLDQLFIWKVCDIKEQLQRVFQYASHNQTGVSTISSATVLLIPKVACTVQLFLCP